MKQDKFKESIKESLDSYSPEVPAHLWENIRAGIPAGPASSTAGNSAAAGSQSGVGTAAIVKWVAAAVVVAGVAVWAWQGTTVGNEPEKTVQVEEQLQTTPAAKELPSESRGGASEASDVSATESVIETPATIPAEEANPIAQTDFTEEANMLEESEAALNDKVESESVVQEEVVKADDSMGQKSQKSQGTTGSAAEDQPSAKAGSKQQVIAEADDEGYSESHTDETVEAYPFVECGILADIVTGEAPLTVFFKNVSEARSYEWNFDNGKKAYKEEATITFDEPGDYAVQLIVTDFDGNQITDEMEITVLEASTCFVPNAFSPNGDGLNDFFLVQGNNISNVIIEIFRLDGSLVFEGKGLTARWDGSDAQKSGNDHDQYMVVTRYIRNDGMPGIDKTMLNVIRE